MINTYHTSLGPPPVPPRLARPHHGSQSMLIPASSVSNNKPIIRFLAAVVLLHLFMSVVGFIYLYMNATQHVCPSSTGTDPVHSMQRQQSSNNIKESPFRALAQMVFEQPKTQQKPIGGYLKWDLSHSQYSKPEINYYHNNWISILESGYYHVYSKVTFSNGSSTSPLTNRVVLRKTKTDKEKVLMQAFCHLDWGKTKSSRLCTATTVDVVKLEKGNQLSVWTENLSLVDYDAGASTFGLYSL